MKALSELYADTVLDQPRTKGLPKITSEKDTYNNGKDNQNVLHSLHESQKTMLQGLETEKGWS